MVAVLLQAALALGGIVIPGGIIMHRTIAIAVRHTIGAGEIFHRVGHVGVGIEQAGGVAAIAQSACGGGLDLHQAVIAFRDDTRIASALALDHAAHQFFRQVVGGGMAGNQRIEIAVGIEPRHAQVLCGSGRGGERDQNGCNANFANHVGSGFWGCSVCG